MTPLDELIAEAEIGEQAKAFLESDLGKVLLGMAQQEVQMAQEGLETVDPMNLIAIRELQNKAWLGRRFEEWLGYLITRGEQAKTIFKQQEGE